MRTRTGVVAILALLAHTVGHCADDLATAVDNAVRSDPTLQKADMARQAIREGRKQARGALLPQLTAATGYEWSRTRDDTSRPLPPFGQATFLKDVDTDAFRWSVELTQTVFRWDQWKELEVADKEALRADIDYLSTEQELYVRVAEAYFDILTREAEVDAARAALAAILQQVEQAEQRLGAGLGAPIDVIEAQSAADRARAAEIRSLRQLASARESLRAITGTAPQRPARLRDDLALEPPSPADQAAWVERAMDQNYRVQSARLGLEIASARTRVARAGHLPQVDLRGSYRDYDIEGDETGFYSLFNGPYLPSDGPLDQLGNEYRLSIDVTIPVFTGGITSSRVTESVYRQREARAELEVIMRDAQREVLDAYEAVLSNMAEVRATRQGLESARRSLEATEAGLDVGTRNTVDLLFSRRQLYDAETAYARSRNAYVVDVLRLKRAAGTLVADDVMVVNSWLSASQTPGDDNRATNPPVGN